MGGLVLSQVEGKVLTSAIMALLDNTSLCSRMKDGRFKIRCGDMSRVKISVDDLIGLNKKILDASGADSGVVDELVGELR